MHGYKPEIHVTLDFETYYDDQYSLRKLSTLSYIKDTRFRAQCCSFYMPQVDPHVIQCVGNAKIEQMFSILKSLQSTYNIRIVGHNLSFDALIARIHFNFETDYYFDTSLLCWFVLGNTLKNAKLETLAKHYDLQPDPKLQKAVYTLLGIALDTTSRKLSAALAKVKGLSVAEMSPNLLAALSAYCAQDVLYTYELYDIFSSQIPAEVLAAQDQRLQALIRLPLEVDVNLLSNLRAKYQENREEDIEAFAASYQEVFGRPIDVLKTIRSKPKFKALLLELGIPESSIPMKPNKKGDGMTEAFAKNDLALEELAELYQDTFLLPEAVDLRLKYNSSMVESKFDAFINAGKTGEWGFHVKAFSAPNTTRHSGGSSTGSSPQNLARATKPDGEMFGLPYKSRKSLGLRDAIMSPVGRELVVADLSGIELRTCMWLANDKPAIAALSDPKRDLYTEDGRIYFDMPDLQKSNKPIRNAAKVVALSAQYLVSAKKIFHQAKVMKAPMTLDMAMQAHKRYRMAHQDIVRLWDFFQKWMRDSTSRYQFEYDLYPLVLRNKEVIMPNGFVMRYPDLRWDSAERRFTYWNANKCFRVNLHAGMMVENCSQGLAANVFNYMQLRCAEALAPLGGIFVGDVHDEMLFTVPDDAGKEALDIMLKIMSEPTPFWPELITFAEGDYGYSRIETDDPNLIQRSRYGCLK